MAKDRFPNRATELLCEQLFQQWIVGINDADWDDELRAWLEEGFIHGFLACWRELHKQGEAA